MMKNNPQLRNVGNMGDILKHAALMNLAKLLIDRSSSRFAYIETHAFMLEASCPNPEKWEQETGTELAKHVVYHDYFVAEKRVTDNRPYRCSAGLVIDELRKAKTTDSVIILAEKDEATREVLKRQLLNDQVNCIVLKEALHLGSIKLPDDVQTLLILVDPFVLDDEIWNEIVVALNDIVKPGVEVVLELFTYDDGQPVVRWPSPPVGMIGPVSVMHRQPYHLAVYAAPYLRDDIAACCSSFGWV